MSKDYIFSSESVGEGHPDKVCDLISDYILDDCLYHDRDSRVACETMVKSNMVVVAGEITTKAPLDYDNIIRSAISDIGYTNDDDVFHAEKVFTMNFLTQQSKDIAQGVNAEAAEGKDTDEQGAGDQGLMFGYACNETPDLMPAPIMYSHQIARRLALKRKHTDEAPWLRPDSKSQVSVKYVNDEPTEITSVVVSTQHTDDVSNSTIREYIIEDVIKKEDGLNRLLTPQTQYLINPTGRFVIGGPQGDSGLTGRKIIVDTYGGMGRVGGGAFSGKDPSKVDRSAAYMCRYVAKNIVAAELAYKCEIQVAYAIGYPDPVSIAIDTFGTGHPGVTDDDLVKVVKEVFSFKPANIVENLDLLRPIYKKTTNYGHFGKGYDDWAFTWEKTDKVNDLKRALDL